MKKADIFDDYEAMLKNISELEINGLRGRMLRMKSSQKKNREILLLYGHHASLERVYGVADAFSEFGNVTVPDLPGFGGMDSFYTIGMKPTLDSLADYLATFIRLRYKRKKITIIGMSLGFAVATRMLQRYPELAKKVDFLVSMAGFMRYDDAKVPKAMTRTYRVLGEVFSRKLPAVFFYNVVLHPSLIRALYAKTPNARAKFKHLSDEEFKRSIEFEVHLWRDNDVRTYMRMLIEMLTLDNLAKQIDLPVHHISVNEDQYLDSVVVEQHMRVVFTDFTSYVAKLPNHAPSIIAKKEEAMPFIPKKLRKVLA